MTFGQFSIDYVFWGAIMSTEIENDYRSYLLKTDVYKRQVFLLSHQGWLLWLPKAVAVSGISADERRPSRAKAKGIRQAKHRYEPSGGDTLRGNTRTYPEHDG